MHPLLHQLLGILVCVISAGVFIHRYDIPTPGLAVGYLAFGSGFVAAGVITGKMLDVEPLSLLLLEHWNINLSLMAIGYSAVASGLLGLYTAIRRFLKGESPP